MTAVLTLFPAEALPPDRDRHRIEAELQEFVRHLLRPGTAADVPDGGLRATALPRVDRLRAEVTVDGVVVRLSGREHSLLRHLDDNRGRVVSRHDILRAVWGWDVPAATRTVDVHVARLRRKLGRHAEALRTVVGAGYVYG